MKKLLLGSVLALGAMTAAANAATYQIDGLINISEYGFGSSLIHEQQANGDMSGAPVAYFSETVDAGGIWEHSGAISFSGMWNGYGYSAEGHLDQATAIGSITFNFAGGAQFDELTFNFEALDMGLPNSFDGSTAYLWGETGTCSATTDSSCYGTDLRISVSEVPLPASLLLMLGGLGTLAASRRKARLS